MRKAVIAGNWKMHKNASETKKYLDSLKSSLPSHLPCRVLLAVPFPSLFPAVEAARYSPIEIGAQNMNDHESGAFTGEVSGGMIKDCGASFVILGHSERRCIFHETDEWICKKVKRALLDGLQPIVCIGETLEQREKGETEEVLKLQMEGSLYGLNSAEVEQILLAYEPIWAIGTGKSASAEIAEQVHSMCRSFLARKWGGKAAQTISILYGGSVKAENIQEYMQKQNIDGALVGGASLEVNSFLKIIHYK